MIFKEEHMKAQLEGCSERLQAIARFVDQTSRQVAGKEIVITRVTDPVCGESGVHLAKRAFDCRHQTSEGFYYTADQVEAIVKAIIARYPRNDGHETALCHSFQGGMFHVHVQIPAVIPASWPEEPAASIT